VWATIWSIIVGLIQKWIGSKDERDIAEQTGERVGRGDDSAKSLDAVQRAQEAANSVSVDIGTHPDKLRADDGYRRPD